MRGEGSYKKAMDTIKIMQPFRKKFKNMGISASMTCTQTNQDFIADEFKNGISQATTKLLEWVE